MTGFINKNKQILTILKNKKMEKGTKKQIEREINVVIDNYKNLTISKLKEQTTKIINKFNKEELSEEVSSYLSDIREEITQIVEVINQINKERVIRNV